VKKTHAQAQAEDRAVRRYLERKRLKSNFQLVEALGAMGFLPRITDDAGQPDHSTIAEYVRRRSDGDEIVLLIADCLDPAVDRKPWRLVFHRGSSRHGRALKKESFGVEATLRMYQAVGRVSGSKRSQKQIIGELAKDLRVSDSRIRQHLAAANKGKKVIDRARKRR
jgi:hypothetical protein